MFFICRDFHQQPLLHRMKYTQTKQKASAEVQPARRYSPASQSHLSSVTCASLTSQCICLPHLQSTSVVLLQHTHHQRSLVSLSVPPGRASFVDCDQTGGLSGTTHKGYWRMEHWVVVVVVAQAVAFVYSGEGGGVRKQRWQGESFRPQTNREQCQGTDGVNVWMLKLPWRTDRAGWNWSAETVQSTRQVQTHFLW